MVLTYFRLGVLSPFEQNRIRTEALSLGIDVTRLDDEACFYVDVQRPLSDKEQSTLEWLLRETFNPECFATESLLARMSDSDASSVIVEIGPRLSFQTPFSSTAVDACHNCGVDPVCRLERSRRIRIGVPEQSMVEQVRERLLPRLFDRMTEQPYSDPLASFDVPGEPESLRVIPLLEEGLEALERYNREMGLGMDAADLAYYDQLFRKLGHNPTDVELFQLAQANSEHCRHWVFRGRIIVDSQERPRTLMEIVQEPWRQRPGCSAIAFHDDSSAIVPPWTTALLAPMDADRPSAYLQQEVFIYPTNTAETHCFPTGVAPYPGAATGTGGRIRDTISVGRGGLTGAAATGYVVGNLHLPDFQLPWEESDLDHPSELASPLQIAIQASDGASNYGNCYGEAVVLGVFRTAGLWIGGRFHAYYKPIMYSAGYGSVKADQAVKGQPKRRLLVIQFGGPAYNIGIGGGSASSMIQGENKASLDYNAVQRGDAVMGRRIANVIRALVESTEGNPIVSIHDLGAGGSCNALTEIVDPEGARLELRALPSGDRLLSPWQLWGNEAQEREVVLIEPDSLLLFEAVCRRESVSMAVVGEITGDGQLVLTDREYPEEPLPVNLPLREILGELPQKTFHTTRWTTEAEPLQLPSDLTVQQALGWVLLLPAVASKGWLTVKVDRSVGGLTAGQQCVGPFQTTLSDYAVTADSHLTTTGTAKSLGEQPLKGLISPEAMARLAVSEMLLNLVGVVITDLHDVRLEANWMLAAKLDAEMDWLYRAAETLADTLIRIGIAIDGGKDSLSLAAKTVDRDGNPTIVKAPGELILAAYAPVPDIRKRVTPDLKPDSDILFVDLSAGRNRLGGTALAQVFSQVGLDCPDVEDVELLVRTFRAVQSLIQEGLITAVHDRSDGGLITAVLEMAFGGGVGLKLDMKGEKNGQIPALFTEEPGLVIGTEHHLTEEVLRRLEEAGIPVVLIGKTSPYDVVSVFYNNETVVCTHVSFLRQRWEETSSRIEKLQANPDCVEQEDKLISIREPKPPEWRLSFRPTKARSRRRKRPKIAVLREQGTNGEREMAAAFHLAGFEPYNVVMTDLLGEATLDEFRGLVFPGGFAHGDVLDSGKLWAATVRFNPHVARQFEQFYLREDTFSLGVCNGCQMMALLGWVPLYGLASDQQPRFIRNLSGRFESRLVTVKIGKSPAIMLAGMEESTLGVIVAHGEGRLIFPQPEIAKRVVENDLAPIRYVTPQGETLEPDANYPHNPNGSYLDIAALCSPDGRHLAMMPHPERLFLDWQWPWRPDEWKNLPASPWLEIFHNAYRWCVQKS